MRAADSNVDADLSKNALSNGPVIYLTGFQVVIEKSFGRFLLAPLDKTPFRMHDVAGLLYVSNSCL